MKVLNLFAGIGGNRLKWSGHEVTAVEFDKKVSDAYSAAFPADVVFCSDAFDFLLKHYFEFDFIWASPPCQSHSRQNYSLGYRLARYPDFRLYSMIVFLKQFYKGLYCIENVFPYYEALIMPNFIAGRHCFWSNFQIPFYKSYPVPGLTSNDQSFSKSDFENYLGIKLNKNIYPSGTHSKNTVFRNCVHPDLGLHIMKTAEQFHTLPQFSLFP